MSIYLSSFIIGFTAAALPGSVQTTLLQSAVLGNSKKIIRFAVGAAVMDGLFLLLAYFGIVQFIDYFYWFKVLVTLSGTAYIGYLGVEGISNSVKKDKGKIRQSNQGFFSGALIVLLHPPTIFYFIGVSAVLFSDGVDYLSVLISSLVLSSGAMICFMSVVLLGCFIHKVGKGYIVQLINILASLILIFFAIKLLLSLF